MATVRAPSITKNMSRANHFLLTVSPRRTSPQNRMNVSSAMTPLMTRASASFLGRSRLPTRVPDDLASGGPCGSGLRSRSGRSWAATTRVDEADPNQSQSRDDDGDDEGDGQDCEEHAHDPCFCFSSSSSLRSWMPVYSRQRRATITSTASPTPQPTLLQLMLATISVYKGLLSGSPMRTRIER